MNCLKKILVLISITKIFIQASDEPPRFEHRSVPVVSLSPKQNEYVMVGYKNSREIGHAYYTVELDTHKKKIIKLRSINIKEGHHYIGHEEAFIEDLKKLAQHNKVHTIVCQTRVGTSMAKIHQQCGACQLYEKDDFALFNYLLN